MLKLTPSPLFSANVADMWINAQVIGDCPGVEYHCHKDTALDGNGISVRYPLNEKATYSRLIYQKIHFSLLAGANLGEYCLELNWRDAFS